MEDKDQLTNSSKFLDINEVGKELFDALEYPIVLINSEGLILFANRAGAELHECTAEEFVGKNIKEFIQADNLGESFGQMQNALTFGIALFESVHLKKSGKSFPVEVFYKILKLNSDKFILTTLRSLSEVKEILKDEKDGGEISAFKKAILNATDDLEKGRRAVQEALNDARKFKMATNSASDHIVITNPEGIIIYANKAVERITGFKNEEVIGKKAGSGELWGGLMSKEFYENLWNVIKKQQKPFSGEIKNKRKNGEFYTSLATISPVIDENGILQFFIGTERDITKEKEIDKSKSEFVSLASHQLRTPLTAVRWYTENLMESASKLNSSQKDSIKEIYAATLRMTELVRSLLNVSRIELSTFSIDPKPVELSDLIKNIIKELEKKIEAKKLKVSFTTSLENNILNADPVILRMLLDNLISNAVKYTDKKGTVNIDLSQKDGFIYFEVKDTGCGIPEKQKEKMFTKFFRADNAVAMETDGNGLGLYMVKEITEKIGGGISFSSAEKKGSTFVLRIPQIGMKKIEGIKKLDV